MKPDEIKKALECCKSPVGSGACNSCPFDYQRKKRLAPTEGSCTVLMFDCVLVYINQLEAEKRNLRKIYTTAKKEAIKEFAERLKEAKTNSTMDSRICTTEMINNLVKEMVGENNV